jgi:hypothetical protein
MKICLIGSIKKNRFREKNSKTTPYSKPFQNKLISNCRICKFPDSFTRPGKIRVWPGRIQAQYEVSGTQVIRRSLLYPDHHNQSIVTGLQVTS